MFFRENVSSLENAFPYLQWEVVKLREHGWWRWRWWFGLKGATQIGALGLILRVRRLRFFRLLRVIDLSGFLGLLAPTCLRPILVGLRRAWLTAIRLRTSVIVFTLLASLLLLLLALLPVRRGVRRYVA